MKYTQLPQVLTENGKTYFLDSAEMCDDPTFRGWWSCQYSESTKDGSYSFPPEATDGGSIYFLISCGPSRKEAEKDLLERINKMTKILTAKEKEKFLKERFKGKKHI